MQKELNHFLDCITLFIDENLPSFMKKPHLQIFITPNRPPTLSIRYDFVLSEQDFLTARKLGADLVGLPHLEVVKGET